MGPPPPKPSDRRATLNPSQMQDWKRPGQVGGDSFSLNSAPAPPPSTHHDAASDPWGAGTTWERDSPAAKAQAARRRQTSYVPGTGTLGSYGGPAQHSDRRASNGAQDEFHSVPSSPWGSPAKNPAPPSGPAGGGYYHGSSAPGGVEPSPP